MATREELDKRWPPRTKFKKPDNARGMDAVEFAARFGEFRARVDIPTKGDASAGTDT
jgi:hypothetical protein